MYIVGSHNLITLGGTCEIYIYMIITNLEEALLQHVVDLCPRRTPTLGI